MDLTDFLSLLGIGATFLFHHLTKIEDTVTSMQASILMQKTTILSNYTDKLENRAKGMLEYEDNIHKDFIEHISNSVENGEEIVKIKRKYDQTGKILLFWGIVALFLLILKYIFMATCDISDSIAIFKNKVSYLNIVIGVNLLLILVYFAKIGFMCSHIKHLKENMKKQANIIIEG